MITNFVDSHFLLLIKMKLLTQHAYAPHTTVNTIHYTAHTVPKQFVTPCLGAKREKEEESEPSFTLFRRFCCLLVKLDVDSVLQQVGEFGKGQQRHFAICMSTWSAVAFQALAAVFSAPDSADWVMCEVKSSNSANCTGTAIQTGAPPCNESLWRYVSSTATVTAEFGLACDRHWIVSFLGSIFFVGYLVGAGASGVIADKYGRLQSFKALVYCLLLFSFITAFSPNVSTLCVARFGSGCFAGGLAMVAYVFTSEVIGPSYRNMASVMGQVAFPIGTMLLPLIAWIWRSSWRMQAVALALPLLPMAAYDMMCTQYLCISVIMLFSIDCRRCWRNRRGGCSRKGG